MASSLSAGGTSGVLEYLQKSLPKATLRQLYVDKEDSKIRQGPFVCRAVLQQLSPVAQQIVSRLACTGGRFDRHGVRAWIHQPQGRGKPSLLQRVLQEMVQWAILEEESLSVNSKEIAMTHEYYQGIRECLLTSALCPWKPVDLSGLPNVLPVTPEALERYSNEVWDKVLHFLVGSDSVEAPSQGVVDFLLSTGLMQQDPDDHSDPAVAELVITEKGYDFMLQDQHRQVWLFVEQSLQMIRESAKDGDENAGLDACRDALLLLICLSLARVGEAYPLKSVPKKVRKYLKGLSYFGLVMIKSIPFPQEDNPKNTVTIFYPTRVATQLLGSTAEDKANLTPASALWSLSSQALESALAHPEPNDSAHLAIIVQTNFQVCAYTTSELHLRMLSLFCDVKSIRRLPNIIFLRITRDAVKGAFNLGIQARQILRFLEKNAHPKLRTRDPNAPAGQGLSPVPANVVDQIWLWDRERARVKMAEVYEHHCTMEEEFRSVVQYSKDVSAHVWSDVSKKVIYVDYRFAERVKGHAQRFRAQHHDRQLRL